MFSTIAIFAAVLVSVSCTDNHHAIDAAVRSSHTMRTMPVVSQHTKDHQAPVVDINSNQLPLTVRLNTHSSNINVIQKHLGHPAKVHQASHTDEPDELIHNVHKPIIQRVHEIVHPYRIITQEIRPAQEKIETIVARDNTNFAGSNRGAFQNNNNQRDNNGNGGLNFQGGNNGLNSYSQRNAVVQRF